MMTTSSSSTRDNRRLTISTTAIATASFILGSATAFNNPWSSLPLASSSSSSSSPSAHCCLPAHRAVVGRIFQNTHRYREKKVSGTGKVNRDLDFGIVLRASAGNNEFTATATATATPSVSSTNTATAIAETLAFDNNDAYKRIYENSITNGEICHDDSERQATSTSAANSNLIAPSIFKILQYTIPAIGIWLCSPVLSMIDTAAVGLLSGTAQQAALNPAASVTDCGALVVAFMYTATTNLIAAAVREDKDDDDKEVLEERASVSLITVSTATTTGFTSGRHQYHFPRKQKTTQTLITALKLALIVGAAFGITLLSTGPHLLQLLMGNSASALDPVVYSAALRYVRIRALGMPAMVVIGTAQSACLGMQDVQSPLYVLLAAAVINFLGDMALVPLKSNLWGGAAGAAWATVASQYAALVFFARWLTMKKFNSTTSNNSTTLISDDDTGSSAALNGKNDNGWARKMTQRLFSKSRRKESVTTINSLATSETNTNKYDNRDVPLADSSLPSSSLSIPATTVARISSHDNGRIDQSGSQPDIKSQVQRQQQQAPNQSELSTNQAVSQTKIRGFLSDSTITLRSFLSLKNFDKKKVKEFFPFVIPVTTTSIGRISGYIAMSHVAASTLGTYDMAGHQIILSIFCCITPFVDALNQVAQAFVPAVFEVKERSLERANALRKTVNNFRLVGLGFGGVLVSLVACIPLISRYFTTDLAVLERVHSAIAPVGLFMLVNGLMCAGEGTLLGQKDLKFLRNMYAIFFFTVPAYMLRLKHRALMGVQTVGVGTMWTAFSMYNVIRASSFHLRLAQLQRRTDKGVKNDTNETLKEER